MKPLSRAKLRHYYRMANVLGTYDSIWGKTLMELGIPICKWIKHCFPLNAKKTPPNPDLEERAEALRIVFSCMFP